MGVVRKRRPARRTIIYHESIREQDWAYLHSLANFIVASCVGVKEPPGSCAKLDMLKPDKDETLFGHIFFAAD